MPRMIEGTLSAVGLRLAVVTTRWNDFITDRLVEGAIDCIRLHGGDVEKTDLVYCPGAFELPLVTDRLAQSGNYDAIVVLGAVIRGATPHFDYVASRAANGIAGVIDRTGVPCGFGVLTVDSIEQAIERAGTKAGNKGWEAALAAIETATLLRAINGGS